MKYTLVSIEDVITDDFEETRIKLIFEVNKLIKDGWEPQGSVSIWDSHGLVYGTQAMVKKK